MITTLLAKFLTPSVRHQYRFQVIDNDVLFLTDKRLDRALADLTADTWLIHQHLYLLMLAEQELAQRVPSGFLVAADVVARLDEEGRELLHLPPRWQGKFSADIQGEVRKLGFAVTLYGSNRDIRATPAWTCQGPFLRFSEETQFTLNEAELAVFSALKKHDASDKQEADHLLLIHALQQAKAAGFDIDLSHFDQLVVHVPQQVGLTVDVTREGDGILTPAFGIQATPEAVGQRLGQLDKSAQTAALRVGDEIVLLDEQRLQMTREILQNRTIPKELLQTFLSKPGAFLDASLVDLELGFALRVSGASVHRHAYFGDMDESGLDWFGGCRIDDVTRSPELLTTIVKDRKTLEETKTKIDAAIATGALEVVIEDKVIDISNPGEVRTILSHIEDELLTPDREIHNVAELVDTRDEPREAAAKAVVDIALNDDKLDIASDQLQVAIEEVLYTGELIWEGIVRQPYAHQQQGVRWILGLLQPNIGGKPITGALLADDMGLGKTFISLAAIYQYYHKQQMERKTCKPVLVVAPLGLLENWRDEVELTFDKNPFRDIVILQNQADLRRFKIKGAQSEVSTQKFDEHASISEEHIRYALKVGSAFGPERLDMPCRLVITTYQTLRDYQFSLCRIDWSFAIFDEAQNIKNPNALQTRAAKGIKASFKLLVTGTPVENHLGDFWCLVDTAMPGYLGSYQHFRQTYVTPILHADPDEVDEVRARYGRQLRLNVGALMLRRLKEDTIDCLPAKHIWVGLSNTSQWRYCPALEAVMTGQQRDTYEAILSDVHTKEMLTLQALHKLRDVSLHPMLVHREHLDVTLNKASIDALVKEGGKLTSLRMVLDDIKAKREKAIIFVINKQLQRFLSAALSTYYNLDLLSIINGDTKAVAKTAGTSTRKDMIRLFEAQNGFNLIIMSPIAAGVGLTITGANHVIHLERHWNPAKEAQATDRVYRIGQQKDVHIHVPILHHPDVESFDVNLHKLLFNKTSLKDAIVTPSEVKPKPDVTRGHYKAKPINTHLPNSR